MNLFQLEIFLLEKYFSVKKAILLTVITVQTCCNYAVLKKIYWSKNKNF